MLDQPDFWRRRGRAACLLWPLSLLFRAVVALHCAAYRRGWLGRYRAPVPVVVVGNITVGGSGKTPLLIALVRYLQGQGVACAVVSRGYGGAAAAPTEVRPDSDARHVGDEPLLMRQATGVPVFVAVRRVDAVKAALAAYPRTQVVLSDDGMQHYALQRDFEIALLAADLGVGNGWLLPAGPLREPVSRLSTVDALLVTRATDVAPSWVHPRAYVVTAQSDGVCSLLDGTLVAWPELAARSPLYLLTAIARPQRLVAMLAANGIALAGAVFCADHAALSTEDAAFAGDGWLLMTGKDAVKTAGWPLAWRQKILIVDYRMPIPDALAAQVATLVKSMNQDESEG